MPVQPAVADNSVEYEGAWTLASQVVGQGVTFSVGSSDPLAILLGELAVPQAMTAEWVEALRQVQPQLPAGEDPAMREFVE